LNAMGEKLMQVSENKEIWDETNISAQ
jgi:hypothetical protein